MSKLLTVFVIFSEPDFPVVDVAELARIDGAIEARSVAELREALQADRVLVWRHGSAFPVEAWEPVRKFLEAGGALLYLGGEPFTRPVVGPPGQRVVEQRTLAMLKALRLNQSYRMEIGAARLAPAGNAGVNGSPRTLSSGGWVSVLEPRFSDTKDFAGEDGASGARDATLTPLAFLHRADDEPRFPANTAALAIDRLRGKWAGGRWVFWLVSVPPTEAELAVLLAAAAKPPVDLRIDPTFGCFHAGERPSLNLRLHRPRATQVEPLDVTLAVEAPDGRVTALPGTQLRGGTHATLQVALDIDRQPGLYRVTASAIDIPRATTGFWIFDPELFASGGPLTLDAYTLLRNGRPEPVVGTTIMSGSVQRKFLFEPNPAEWDDTFAELESLHINLVRTGVWSAWRKISLDPNVVDEAWLRALEAYYLTARKHGIPVVFTLFSFLPESFGGENPYLDPRAVEGQRAYAAALAARFAPAKEILWDLINEPSFSSPKQLWKCRPNGDTHEKEAFLAWLRRRFAPAGSTPDDTTWQAVVRGRWRLAPDDPIGLPTDEDFEDKNVFEARRPYRAAEYVRFAQDAFGDWTRAMTTAIRQAGSDAPITVGQDEGGLFQRPSPLFFHPAVDFTSMHTWWLNDALLWDGMASKAPGKPLLVSETGVMQRELLSGEAMREPEDFAKLLSRKIGYAFAAGAFGVVQWCYDVNPYMASDNEVAIGLKRVDGSFKPEHGVLREFASFIARNRERFSAPREPEVVVVVPSAEQFSPRDEAANAVRRSVRTLTHELGVAARLVPDDRLALDLGEPRAIVLPACRGVSESGWQALLSAAKAGTALLCSGWFECDEVGHEAVRLGVKKRAAAHVETATSAGIPPKADSQKTFTLRFPTSVAESWYAAEAPSTAHRVRLDDAEVYHHPLPLEWCDSGEALRDFYAAGLAGARISLTDAPPAAAAAGVLVRWIEFREADLIIAVNESSRPTDVALGEAAGKLHVPAGVARMALLDKARARVLDRSHK